MSAECAPHSRQARYLDPLSYHLAENRETGIKGLINPGAGGMRNKERQD